MRVALRIVAGLTIVCPLAAVAVFSADTSGGEISLLGLAGIMLLLLGVVDAFTTTALGLVACAMGRQFVWLGALLVAALLPFIGIAVANALASQRAGQYDTVTGPQPHTAFELFIAGLPGTAYNAIIVGGPVLIGLVAFIYSFRLRDPAAVGVPATSTMARR